jgi:hypothetical protein
MWLRKSSRIGGASLLIGLLASTASAENRDPLLLYSSNDLIVRAHVQAGLNLVGEEALFWDLAGTFASAANYNPDKFWLEGYVKPGLSFRRDVSDRNTIYGMVSGVWSGTLGIDAYDYGDTGRLTLEQGYVGVLSQAPGGLSIDLSAGARELRLGTGMLIANGGGNGFERGALKLGPRKAWEVAGIGKFTYDGFSATGFYLDANEVPSNDAFTALAGGDFRYDNTDGGFVGLTYANAVESDSVYPRAMPPPDNIITNGRDGLNVINAYGRTGKLKGAFADWYFSADFAYEWNSRIDMQAWGGRAQLAYTFANAAWTPRLMYTFQSFSGDDRDTAALERFDPLFYDGSPSSWATGSKSAMTFINSNVNAHQVELSVRPSEQDTITLRYAHIRANELRSPIQFGQATRFDFAGTDRDNIIAGVTDPYLADDLFLEYSRIINPNTYLTAGISASFPGEGLELAARRDLPVWLGGFVNVVIDY